MPLRKGPPSNNCITSIRHRYTSGEPLESIAESIGYKAETLARYLAKPPEVHPQAVNSSIRITTPGGARIEGLTLTELIRLARAL